MKIITLKTKKMIPLTNDTTESRKLPHLQKTFQDNYTKEEILQGQRSLSLTGKYKGAAHSISKLKYRMPKVIPVIYSGFNYDYHFIIKELAKEFEG